MVSVGGVGKPSPIASYTEVLVCTWPLVPKTSPVFSVNRLSAMLLAELPLNRLFAFTALKVKLLLVSRWPLDTIPWLPRPSLLPEPDKKSALVPGARIASCVKLPVPSGTD
jgi:hypothetical protein